ncbi:hypothetical protein P12x_005541 [Tundrisphaera lichenicola]|uniref:hypothetical protein n=1 Tax=Tundrisphaera lichenicola TaxID=2029860 RepID=UPI003EBA0DE1
MGLDHSVPGGRWQVRLGDLAMVVVGSAYVLDVARRSRTTWSGGLPDLEHALGLIVLTLGVGLVLTLAGQGVRALRGPVEGSQDFRIWGVAWRAMALGWLGWSVIEGSLALQAEPGSGWLGQATNGEMRLRLIPLMTTLGMIGLVLALGPLPVRRVPAGRSRRSWPLVLLAGLGGLAIVASGYGLIPYLVLLAMEAVRLALTHGPLIPLPSIFDRLTRAGLETLPGLAACLATAIWLDEDLRTSARDPARARAARSWAGVVTRASTVLLAAAGSAYVLLDSIPRLSPPLSEGIAMMVDPWSFLAIVLGFVGLSAGIAARPSARLAEESAGDRPAVVEEPSGIGVWPRRIIGGMACLVAIEVTAAAIQSIRRDLDDRWYIPISIDRWVVILKAPLAWLGYSTSGANWLLLIDRPSDALMFAASAWLAVRLLILMVSRQTGRPAPFDLLTVDRQTFGRFLGWSVALATLMLASLPLLAVAGVVLTHLMLRWVAG